MSSTAPSSDARGARRPARAASKRTVGLGVLAFTLLLGACGQSEDLGGKVVKDGLGCTVSEVDRRTDDVPTVPEDVKVGKATESTDVEKAPAKACVADATQYLTVDMVGATTDGKVFTDTFESDRPLTLSVGQSKLITGLETGLTGMKVGSRRQIVVPAAEAYGKDGLEALGIGPDEDLVFTVDLISLTDTPTYCNEVLSVPEGKREGKPTEIEMPKEAPTDKVEVKVIKEGDGPEVTDTSYVTVEYAGFSCAYGSQFDSSWDREEPITIAMPKAEPTATASSVIPGWNKGLKGQKEGSIVQLEIPFEDAYGTAGQPPDIGPSDPLVFYIQIVKVSDEAPADPTASTTVPADTSSTTAPADDASTTTAPSK